MLVKLRNALFLGELFEQQEEDNVVRKNNDLPGLSFLHQPPCDTVAPFVIEGRHRIIKHDAGGIIGGAEFRKECRYGQAALLAFAHYLRQFNTGRARKDEFVIENAFRSAGFPKFDFNVAEGEIGQFVLKALLELLRYRVLRDGGALLRDGVSRRIVDAQPVGGGLLFALDLVQNELIHAGRGACGRAAPGPRRSCVRVFRQSR